MFDFLNDTALFLTFFLIVVRTVSILATAPVFGSSVIKPHIRLLLAVVMAMVMIPTVTKLKVSDPTSPMIIMMTGKEVLIGICIGFLSHFLFAGVQLGGQIIGTQMGFGVANVFDPQSNTQISIISQFKNIAMLLIFIALGGHLMMIEAIAASFKVLPLGFYTIHAGAFLFLVKLFAYVFITALKITAPVFITLLVLQLVMGIMGRMVPQLNIMMVGFPLQIAVGMIVLALSMNYFYIVFEKLMQSYFEQVANLLRYL